MTVVLGYSCKDYSLLLSDKRATEANGDFHDEAEKLTIISNKGWASAIGHAGLAEVTFNEITSVKINEFVDIFNVYQRMYNIAVSGGVVENNDGSMIIFTFYNDDRFTLYTLDGSSPELKPVAFEKKIIMNGSISIIDEICSRYSYGVDIAGSMNNVIHTMQSMFRDISSESNHKSDHFDIGITYHEYGKIKIGKIEKHLPVEDFGYNWMSMIRWIS